MNRRERRAMAREVRALFDEKNLRLLRRQTARRRLGFDLPRPLGAWSRLMRTLFGKETA